MLWYCRDVFGSVVNKLDVVDGKFAFLSAEWKDTVRLSKDQVHQINERLVSLLLVCRRAVLPQLFLDSLVLEPALLRYLRGPLAEYLWREPEVHVEPIQNGSCDGVRQVLDDIARHRPQRAIRLHEVVYDLAIRCSDLRQRWMNVAFWLRLYFARRCLESVAGDRTYEFRSGCPFDVQSVRNSLDERFSGGRCFESGLRNEGGGGRGTGATTGSGV